MNLVELNSPLTASLPVRALADHLRLGTGFTDDGSQDVLLEAYLRAAMAAVEARTGKVLLSRDFAWEIGRWIKPDEQGLPVAPVSAIASLVTINREGTETAAPNITYRLRVDSQRPKITANGYLPAIPTDGAARITFTAGYGVAWASVPADLQQAVMLLAAYFYEHRNEAQGSGGFMPFGVLSLIERYRSIRLMGDAL